MVRLYEKLNRATAALEWFTTRDWSFKSNNVIEMSHELQGIDKKVTCGAKPPKGLLSHPTRPHRPSTLTFATCSGRTTGRTTFLAFESSYSRSQWIRCRKHAANWNGNTREVIPSSHLTNCLVVASLSEFTTRTSLSPSFCSLVCGTCFSELH